MKKKNLKGSLLIISILIMSMILVIGLTLSSVSVKNRRASITSGRSVQTFQLAEEGIELVLDDIKNGSHPNGVSDIDNNIDSIISATCTGGLIRTANFTVELIDVDDNRIPCSHPGPVTEIARVKSIGEDASGQARAIEAAIIPTTP